MFENFISRWIFFVYWVIYSYILGVYYMLEIIWGFMYVVSSFFEEFDDLDGYKYW